MAEYKNYNYYTSDNFTKSEEPEIKDVELEENLYVINNNTSQNKKINKKRILATYKELIIIGTCIVTAIFLAVIISKYVLHHTTVDGVSMSYTLKNGDVLIIDKLTYRFSKPRRFDIVVFPISEDEYYIKRIIGMPNETVQIIDGKVYINEQLLDDPYGYEDITYFGEANSPIKIGDGQYFVLGDNRNKSVDSREASIGLIEEDDIIGRAVFVLYPIRSFGTINHDANAGIRENNEK